MRYGYCLNDEKNNNNDDFQNEDGASVSGHAYAVWWQQCMSYKHTHTANSKNVRGHARAKERPV